MCSYYIPLVSLKVDATFAYFSKTVQPECSINLLQASVFPIYSRKKVKRHIILGNLAMFLVKIQYVPETVPEQVCTPINGCRGIPSATVAVVFHAYHQSGGSSDPQRVCD